MRYAKGPVAEQGAHATLLYGLTPDGDAGVRQRESIDELLDGLDLSAVTVEDVDYFPGMFGLPYTCVIAHVTSPDLVEANRRLRFLPHVDTFVEYRPHVRMTGSTTITSPTRGMGHESLGSVTGATLGRRGQGFSETGRRQIAPPGLPSRTRTHPHPRPGVHSWR